MVPKIFCLSRLNSWRNLIDLSRKIQAVTRIKVNNNKGICPDLGRIFLDGSRDDHDDMPLVDPDMNLPPCHLCDLPYLSLVLIRLEFIIGLIESACTSLLLANLDPLL